MPALPPISTRAASNASNEAGPSYSKDFNASLSPQDVDAITPVSSAVSSPPTPKGAVSDASLAVKDDESPVNSRLINPTSLGGLKVIVSSADSPRAKRNLESSTYKDGIIKKALTQQGEIIEKDFNALNLRIDEVLRHKEITFAEAAELQREANHFSSQFKKSTVAPFPEPSKAPVSGAGQRVIQALVDNGNISGEPRNIAHQELFKDNVKSWLADTQKAIFAEPSKEGSLLPSSLSNVKIKVQKTELPKEQETQEKNSIKKTVRSKLSRIMSKLSLSSGESTAEQQASSNKKA